MKGRYINMFNLFKKRDNYEEIKDFIISEISLHEYCMATMQEHLDAAQSNEAASAYQWSISNHKSSINSLKNVLNKIDTVQRRA